MTLRQLISGAGHSLTKARPPHCCNVRMQAFASSTGNHQVAFVTGASRGLGLEYARQLLQRPGQQVIGACRSPENANELQDLASQHPEQLTLVPLDVTEEKSIQAAAKSVSEKFEHVHLLLNVAGILHVPGELSPEISLSRITPENLQRNFQINAFGPILVNKAFWPLMAKASSSDEQPAKMVSMSARVGSISDNDIGGWYSYRASKSALNQLNRCMVKELARKKQKICALLLHPGTVDTDLSKPFQGNVRPEKLFTKERAIKQLLDIIDSATMKDTGRFIAWDGKDIPW